MTSYVEMKKLRPQTTKSIRQKSAVIRPKTTTTTNKKPIQIDEFKNLNASVKKDYRFLRPPSTIKDSKYNQYWQEKDENSIKMLSGRPYSSTKPNENLLFNPIILNYNKSYETGTANRSLYKFPMINWDNKKQHSFLTSVGGTEAKLTNFCLSSTNNSELSSNLSLNTYNSTNMLNSRPGSSIFTNILKRPLTTVNPSNKNRINSGTNQPPIILKGRPVTAKDKQLPLSGKKNFRQYSGKEILSNNIENKGFNKDYQAAIDELVEDSLSLADIDESANEPRYRSNYYMVDNKRCPKVANLLNNYNKINVKENSIKIMAADTDLLDIFDRSQRTRAATLAKTGDFDYYTPFQRIGCFMDFFMFLKWVDLKNIQKTVVDSGSQVGYLTTKKTSNTKNNFSLFHGYMRNEGEWKKYNEALINNPKLTYDPEVFLPKVFNINLHNPQTWGDEIRNKIMISVNNYNKYLNSDKIIMDDLYPFDNNNKKKFLSHIDFDYSRFPHLIEEIFEEIIDNYYLSLKNIILEYILISPYERNRLNIHYLPRKSLPSSFIIASHGSFNRTLYTGWVENYFRTSEVLNRILLNCNVINSALIDWKQCFNHICFFLTKNLEVFVLDNKKTIHIDEFYNIQNNYV